MRSLFHTSTGQFSGQRLNGSAQFIALNTPIGFASIEGEYDHLSQRVDLATGEIVSWQPPAPVDDEMRSWQWDVAAKRYRCTPTQAAIEMDVRAERDRRFAEWDWVTLRAYRRGEPVPADVAAYLQALADLPAQEGFPYTHTWPTPPERPAQP